MPMPRKTAAAPAAPRPRAARKPAEPPAVVALDALAGSIAALRRVQARKKKLAAEEGKYIAEIKEAMGESPSGSVAGAPVVRWATTARMTVDTKAVKEKFPDVAAACSRVTAVRTFQLIDPA